MRAWMSARRAANLKADKELVLRFIRRSGVSWNAYDLHLEVGLRPGRLYPALHGLLRDGLLTDHWVPTPGSKHSRRYYSAAD